MNNKNEKIGLIFLDIKVHKIRRDFPLNLESETNDRVLIGCLNG